MASLNRVSFLHNGKCSCNILMKVTADYRNSIDFDTLLRKREKGRGTGKERHRENDEDGFESSRFLLKWRT